MSRLAFFRNVLILVGAYYVSFIILFIAFPLMKLTEGHIYSGPWGAVAMHAESGVWLAVAAVAAGALSGLLVEVVKVRPWSFGCGGFVFLTHVLNTGRRFVPWTLEDVIGHVIESLIPGIASGVAFYLVCRRANSHQRNFTDGAPGP